MNDEQALPAMRPVDTIPFRNQENETYVALRDMAQISRHPIAVSIPGYFVATQLDGIRTVADVQAGFLEQFGQRMPADQIRKLIEALDDALLLQNDRFEAAYAKCRDEYLASAARDNRDRWASAAELREQIERMHASGTVSNTSGELRGIIAPHLDYARGRPCYADAYATLAASEPAERFVILATNHFGRSQSVVATGKDFLTPLGRAATDRELIGRIEGRLGRSICVHEFDHNLEHSVELQVHNLQVCCAERPFEIVPVLCPDPCTPADGAANDGPELGAFADALRAELANDGRKTVLIAGADLSHVGQHFGDPDPTTPAFLERVRDHDRRLLGLLERREEERFVAEIRATRNPTRICSVGCIYALLRALPDARCNVVNYHQAVNMETETHVTCTAAIVA